MHQYSKKVFQVSRNRRTFPYNVGRSNEYKIKRTFMDTSIYASFIWLHWFKKLGDLSCPVYFSSLHQSHDLSNKILAKFNVDIMTNELSDKIRQFPSNSKDKTNFWEFVIFRYYYYATMLGFLHHSIQKHRSGCKLSHPVVLDYYWMTILQGSQSLSDLAAYIARSMKSIHVSSVM